MTAIDFRQKQVLVTGAGGFIGSHLCHALVQAGAKVRALIRYSSQASPGNLALLPREIFSEIELAAGNVEDTEQMQRASENCAVVFHLAALIGIPYSYDAPRSYLQTNVVGTLNMLEAARALHTPRVVFCSTSEIYGSARTLPITEDHVLQGQSPYAASKIAAEKLAESFYCSFQLPVVTLRIFNTYGPFQSARALIPSIILQALHQPEVQLGNLGTRRDFNYVSDTCDGLLRAGAVAGAEGLICNLGTGEMFTVRNIAEKILRVMQLEKPITSVSERLRPEASEVTQLQADNRLARERLGWQPQVTLEEGLARTIEYFRQHSPVSDGRYVV
ncbi:MAG: NAD-dependent epimerase/dehydratase family protein [Verrucomicrobiota bacterium]|nr:NAD-dependent epimerase/dehydratase family protein [Verrucomicrobiota bacterium]